MDTVAPAYLTVREVAQAQRVDQEVVLSWINRGGLRATNVAAAGAVRPRWRIRPADLDTFLAARASTPPAPPPARRKPKGPEVVAYF